MTRTLPTSARVAVSSIFALNGALLANWISRIPAVKSQLALNDAELGLALLGLAIGALMAFPVAGWFISRVGSRRVMVVSLLLMCAALPAAALASSLPLLALALVFLGAGNGATDVAMNAQAVEVEKAYRQPILSSFHAMWSLGSLIGAGIGGCWLARASRPRQRQDRSRDEVARTESARRLWGLAAPPAGSPVETYLRGRGITSPLPYSIRYLADAKHPEADKRLPCMLSAVTKWPSNRVVAVHRAVPNISEPRHRGHHGDGGAQGLISPLLCSGAYSA